ncbi:hypothetical protein [Arthrobacter sp. AFG20]|uniref:hypothetical protein n=1 Tax=Arthrobacter sp. AFG20 TaxID=1688671 RepID=UPI000C9E204A|nr:hypothetical protein [Arthrobacter sp. AFG20]PNH78173.1 hypothetical protein CXZ05_22285 [Arthrobacter sp. AFG20]
MSANAESRLQTTTVYLNFGPWSAELRGDELVHICHRGLPVLRGLRAVVRNHNWLTLTPRIMSSRTEELADSLRVVLDVEWNGYSARYAGGVTLLFQAAKVMVSFDGAAVEEFASNRIGLVVLHHPDDAGRPITVTSPSGNRTKAAFPTHISAHQPFKDIAALDWERDNVAFRLDFDGDVFETEDQRNWTDASFKTYSTPLSKPFPVTHRAGDTVRQSIRLSARHIIRVMDETRGTVPELGTSTQGTTHKTPEFTAPLPADFGPLLAEVAVEPDPAMGLISPSEAADLARRLNLPMDARIVAGTPEDAVAVLRSLPLDRLTRLGVYSKTTHITEDDLWGALTGEAKELGFQGEFLAGARSHFTELNRNQHSARQDADAVTYSITPQMHTTEPRAIIDTLPMQTLTADAALRIGNGRPLNIGPVTLAPRFNAVATQPPAQEELPARDALQGTPFAVAWLLGSVTALTGPGTGSISYATISELGSTAGQLLLQLAAQRGREVLVTDTRPEVVAVYPVQTPGGVLTFVGNLTADNIAIRLVGLSGTRSDFSLAPWQTATMLLS